MSGTSNGRILRTAIAASLAVHLTLALLVHTSRVTAAPEQKPLKTTIFHLKLPTPAPTPTPQPAKPRHVEHARRAQPKRPVIHTVHLTSSSRRDAAVAQPPEPAATGVPEPYDPGTPEPDVTDAPPLPTPTLKPACSAPGIPAKAVVAVAPAAPPDVDAQNVTAKIKVDLDAAGSVQAVSVYESTGYQQLDRAALEAARESRYAPEEKDCRDIAGSYLFTVDFSQ